MPQFRARVVYVNTDKTELALENIPPTDENDDDDNNGGDEGGTSGAITTTGSLMWEIIRGNKCKSFLPLRIPSAHRLFCFAPFGNPIDCNLGLFNCISKNHPDPIKVPSTSHYTMAMEL